MSGFGVFIVFVLGLVFEVFHWNNSYYLMREVCRLWSHIFTKISKSRIRSGVGRVSQFSVIFSQFSHLQAARSSFAFDLSYWHRLLCISSRSLKVFVHTASKELFTTVRRKFYNVILTMDLLSFSRSLTLPIWSGRFGVSVA